MMKNLENENKFLLSVLDKIVDMLKESNVYPSLNGKLYLEDGVKIVKFIKKCKSKLEK